MTLDSFIEHRTLPRDLSWSSHQHTDFERQIPTDWPSTEQAQRILTRNYGGRVLVCMPLWLFPSLERSAPIFTTLTGTRRVQTIDEIADLFDAVERHLGPRRGPGGFHYGVRFETVQTFSNTPARFLDDLESIEAYASQADTVPAPRIEQSRAPNVAVGAGVWETDLGWFYLEATQERNGTAFNVQYGLLLRGPVLDTTDITPFFEAIDEDRPRTHDQWPLRRLDLSGNRGKVLSRTVQITDEFRPETFANTEAAATDDAAYERPSLGIHGTNPLFGTSLSSLSDQSFSKELKQEVYDPLSAVSTLPYDVTEWGAEEAQYGIDRVIAIEPPVRRSLFVTATLRPHW